MQKTENYNLNKPEVTDPLRVEDFNENADMIDAALGQCGKIAIGSYVGTGIYGKDNPNTLIFDFTPKLVFVRALLTAEEGSGDTKYCDLMLHNPSGKGFGTTSPGSTNWISYMTPASVNVRWSDCGVSWYHTVNAGKQGNFNGITYIYWAFG